MAETRRLLVSKSSRRMAVSRTLPRRLLDDRSCTTSRWSAYAMGSMRHFDTWNIANHLRSLTYSCPTKFPSVASSSSIAHSILFAIMSAVSWLLRDASFATILILRGIPNHLLSFRFWNRKRLLSTLLVAKNPIASPDLTLPSFNSRRVFDNWS